MRVSRLARVGVPVIGLSVLLLAAGLLLPQAAARYAEGRLRAETGQDWRVGSVGIAFDPGPAVVIRSAVVTPGAGMGTRWAGASLTAARLVLGSPLDLVGDAPDSGRILAEGLAVRLPERVASVAGGPVLVPSLRLDYDRRPAAPRQRVEARFAAGGHGVTLALERTRDGEAALRLAAAPEAGAGRSVSATGRIAQGGDTLRLDDLAGTIDGEPFSGRASLALRDLPRLTLALRLDALVLRPADEASAPARSGEGLVVPVDWTLLPDARWFALFEGEAALDVAKVSAGEARVADVALKVLVRGGRLDAALANAAAYGGTVKGRYVLGPDPDGSDRHQLGLSLSRIGVLPLLSGLLGARGVEGTGTARIDLQARGRDLPALRASTTGSAEVTVSDGRIDALGLAGLAGGERGGRTRLDRLGCSFSVAEGRALTNDIVLKTDLVEASGIGSLDLFAQTLDLRLKPQALLPRPGRPGTAIGRLNVPVRIVGPWRGPAVEADVSGIAENPGGALETLQELGERVLGEGGLDLGGLGDLLGPLLPKAPPGAAPGLPPGAPPGGRLPAPRGPRLPGQNP